MSAQKRDSILSIELPHGTFPVPDGNNGTNEVLLTLR